MAEPISDKRLERLTALAELPCSCDNADCQNYMSALTAQQAQELAAETQQLREQLAAANGRAEKAEALAEQRKNWQLRLAQREAQLMAENEQLRARLGDAKTEQGIRWPNGTDEQWCGHSTLSIMAVAADQGGQYIERTAYRGPWLAAGGRAPADATATALSATLPASQDTDGSRVELEFAEPQRPNCRCSPIPAEHVFAAGTHTGMVRAPLLRAAPRPQDAGQDTAKETGA
jgi:hypothetical protein